MKNNHINPSGDLHMIDISEKEVTLRIAKAIGEITINDQAFDSILQLTNKKGDVLNTARIAGINAVKQTPNLIPLAHTVVITAVSIDFKIEETLNKITKSSSSIELSRDITLSFGALARGLKSERSESAHVLASQRPKGVPTAFC